jgi:exodeoxyribonuclease III
MKLVSFNVNSIRSRLHQLGRLIELHQPEIIGLQETKVQDQDFPLEAVQELGYHCIFTGQKTHYGVALLSRSEPAAVQLGFPTDQPEAQKRLISARYRLPDGQPLQVVNGYFPQGESRDHPVKFPAKQKFYADLQAYLQQSCDPKLPLVVMGDFNIAPTDLDIGIGEENARRWLRTGKTSFLPEERAWFERLTTWGLTDSFRYRQPDCADRFSWFDYRSRGFEADPKRGLRIDHILLTGALLDRCHAVGIDYAIRAMDKPSDHCPVWVELKP